MKLQDGFGVGGMDIEPDGFIAFSQKHCSCDRCKSIVKDLVPLQYIQECSSCNDRYAFLLKTTSNVDMYKQLCSKCYIKAVGLEKAMKIKDIYIWLHPSEYEMWGICADDIGVLIEDTKTGHRLFIPMPEANQEMLKKYNFVFRGGGREALQQAKILCDQNLIAGSNCMEENIDWDEPSVVNNEEHNIHDGTTIKSHSNRKARRAAAKQWKEHLAECPECAEAEKANKPSLKERLFGKKKIKGCGAGLSADDGDDGCFDETNTHKGQYKQVLGGTSAYRNGNDLEITTADVIAKKLDCSTKDAEKFLQQMKAEGAVEWTDEGWRLTPEHREAMRNRRDRHA